MKKILLPLILTGIFATSVKAQDNMHFKAGLTANDGTNLTVGMEQQAGPSEKVYLDFNLALDVSLNAGVKLYNPIQTGSLENYIGVGAGASKIGEIDGRFLGYGKLGIEKRLFRDNYGFIEVQPQIQESANHEGVEYVTRLSAGIKF